MASSPVYRMAHCLKEMTYSDMMSIAEVFSDWTDLSHLSVKPTISRHEMANHLNMWANDTIEEF